MKTHSGEMSQRFQVFRGGRIAAVSLSVVAALAACGCGYKVSGKNRYLPPEIHRISVPVFGNETGQVELEQRITESLLRELKKRGDYQTQTEREYADAVLEGAVTGYSALPVALDAQGGATRVEVTIQARVKLMEFRTGRILWSQDHMIFRSQYEVDRAARTSFDRQQVAHEKIARDFAETIVTSILEGF